MYQQFFGFSGFPFSIAPNPDVLYLSQSHGEALKTLQYGLNREGGFIMLTGEVGTGKTTLIRLLLQSLTKDGSINEKVAYILNPRLSEYDLLYSVAEELSLQVGKEQSIRDLIEAINEALLAAHGHGQKVILVIEEAQNLSPELLEMLRLLTNLETNNQKLLTIMLVGQSELLEMINSQQLRQLNQRIIARYHLQELSRTEVGRYLDYRLQQVGGHGKQISLRARWLLYSRAQGIPRVINLIADAAFIHAYRKHRDKVIARDVNYAANKLNIGNRRYKGLWVLIALLLISSGLWLYMQKTQDSPLEVNRQTTITSPQVTQSEPSQKDKPIVEVEPVEGQLSPLQLLLAQWGYRLDEPLTWQNYCSINSHQLYCYEGKQETLDNLKQMNLPGIVTYIDSLGEVRQGVAVGMDNNTITIALKNRRQTLSNIEFSNQWLRDIKLLRPNIPGFKAELSLNNSNKELLNWVQQRLKEAGVIDHVMITGGIYNQIIVDAVVRFQRNNNLDPDGVLGIKTLLALIPERDKLTMPTLLVQDDRIE